MKLKFIVTLVIIIAAKVVFSQNSSIKGKVIDEKTGETLPGVAVVLKGTTNGSLTDLDGAFSINNLAVGSYSLECKMVSYNIKIITDVVVKAGEPTILTIAMQTASTVALFFCKINKAPVVSLLKVVVTSTVPKSVEAACIAIVRIVGSAALTATSVIILVL